jgi:hypothetical protein
VTTFPGWIAAIATVGLLIGAVVTAYYAKQAFGKQSDQLEDQRTVNKKQTSVLKLQQLELQASLEQRKRDQLQRRSAQASQVFVYLLTNPAEDDLRAAAAQMDAAIRGGNTSTTLLVAQFVNRSDRPIYDIAAQGLTDDGPFGEPQTSGS